MATLRASTRRSVADSPAVMLKKNGAASIGFTIGNKAANVSRKALAMSFRDPLVTVRSRAAPTCGTTGAALLRRVMHPRPQST